ERGSDRTELHQENKVPGNLRAKILPASSHAPSLYLARAFGRSTKAKQRPLTSTNKGRLTELDSRRQKYGGVPLKLFFPPAPSSHLVSLCCAPASPLTR